MGPTRYSVSAYRQRSLSGLGLRDKGPISLKYLVLLQSIRFRFLHDTKVCYVLFSPYTFWTLKSLACFAPPAPIFE